MAKAVDSGFSIAIHVRSSRDGRSLENAMSAGVAFALIADPSGHVVGLAQQF